MITVSESFVDTIQKLPKDVKSKTWKVMNLLIKNPRHPSLHLKKIPGAKSESVYECRVDRFWRLILLSQPDAQYSFVAVGPHDAAIAEGKRMMVREEPAHYCVSIVDSFLYATGKLDFVSIDETEIASMLAS